MKLLALDPALSCGFAWSDGERLEYGVWELAGRGDEHPGNRLLRLRRQLQETGANLGIERIAFEDASFGSINPAIQCQHNMLRGVIVEYAAEESIPFVAFKPATIKKFATGSGRAKKDQMIRALETHFGIRTQSSDVADAIFVLELAKQEHKTQSRIVAVARKQPKRRKIEPRLF